MKKGSLRIFILNFCFVFVLLFFVGCDFKVYTGKHADLFTVAINSVLWNRGHSYGADHPINSEIKIIERDDFGRTLYSYLEGFYIYPTKGSYALIISQYTSDGQVYYYEDCNYSLLELPYSQIYEPEMIEQLKEVNDWGKPINTDKCIGKTIIKKKLTNSELENAVIDKAITEYNLSESNYRACADYLTDDKNGNCIFYGAINRVSGEEVIFFVAFVRADGDIKLFVPSDVYNYQEEFKNFKAENGWVS